MINPLKHGSSDYPYAIQIAERMKITELRNVLARLQAHKMDYDFFGITSPLASKNKSRWAASGARSRKSTA